jgi:hypothetical protein
MGIELVSRSSEGGSLHYNWDGWRWIREFATANGISPVEFADSNDGDELSPVTCHAFATVIDSHHKEYNKVFTGAYYGRAPAKKHARIWRESDGFEQW